MNLENLTIEKAIDNELNIGESICMDDIIDNIEVDGADEWVLDEAQANQVITSLVNDPTITDDYWEEKVQHIRDDLCFQLEQYGCIDVNEIADFHGSAVYSMVEKYL